MGLVRVLCAGALAFITAGIAGGFFGAMLGINELSTLIALVLMVPLFFSFLGILRRSSKRKVSGNIDTTTDSY